MREARVLKRLLAGTPTGGPAGAGLFAGTPTGGPAGAGLPPSGDAVPAKWALCFEDSTYHGEVSRAGWRGHRSRQRGRPQPP